MSSKFERLSYDEIRRELDAASKCDTADRESLRLANDYLEENQIVHVERELSDRYPRSQSTSQPIRAVAIPLTERYASEAATGYNRPVKRELYNADGAVNEELSKDYNDALDAADNDQVMHRVETIVAVARVCCVWSQVKRGMYTPVIALPAESYPIFSSETEVPPDRNDQLDLLSTVVDLGSEGTDGKSSFAWVSAASTSFYRGANVYMPDDIDVHDNPFMWPQVVDDDYIKRGAKSRTLPLMPFAWVNDRKPVNGMLPKHDSLIARINNEIDVHLSVIMNTIGRQGWSQLVFRAMSPDSIPSTLQLGTNQVSCLTGIDESLDYINASTPFGSIVDVLMNMVKLLAMAKRQNPNDFSPESASAVSGFSKLVDSIPKIEAREEHLRQMARIEDKYLWPCRASIMSYTGQIKANVETLAKFKHKITFADLSFPKSVQEIVQMETHELDKGIKTISEIVADRRGITVAEAEKILYPEEEVDAETGEVVGKDDKVQEKALNGAQVTSLVDVVSKASLGEIPRDSAVKIISVAFQIEEWQAEQIVGSAGAGHVVPAQEKQPVPETATEATAEKQPVPEKPKASEPNDILGSIIRRRKRTDA